MHIITNLNEIPSLPSVPLGLTIGSFDGIHLGHVALMNSLRQRVGESGLTAVLTFKNHPTHVLNTKAPLPLICSLPQKIRLLKDHGIDLLLLLDFTSALADVSFDQFLDQITLSYPFSFLMLGEGAVFGKQRKGDEQALRSYATHNHFCVEYLKKITLNNQEISSGRIRQLIEAADFSSASKLLGRPYSLVLPFRQDLLSPTTYWLSSKGICIPPSGTYPVLISIYPLPLIPPSSHPSKPLQPQQQAVITIQKEASILKLDCPDLIFNSHESHIELFFYP